MPDRLPPVPRATHRLVAQRLVADKPEAATTGRAIDLGHWVIIHDLDRVAAVWAADVQGPRCRHLLGAGVTMGLFLRRLRRRGESLADLLRILRKPLKILLGRRLLTLAQTIFQFQRQQFSKERSSSSLWHGVQIVADLRLLAQLPGCFETIAGLVNLSH